MKTHTIPLAAAALAATWLALVAPPASAGRAGQLWFRPNAVTGEVEARDDQVSALFVRAYRDGRNAFGAAIACGLPEVGLVGFVENPDKVLDLPRKVHLEQSRDVYVRFDSALNGFAEGTVPSCKAKVVAVDKDRDGDVVDGTDSITVSLKCGADLPANLGLDEKQTAELVGVLGEKVRCTGKATPRSACFRGDTLVATASGPRPIRDVRVGDRVWSWDEQRNRTVLRRVRRVYQKPGQGLRAVHVGDETLYTTDAHPYWVEGRGWTNAMRLAEGDVLRTQDGHRLTLTKNERLTGERFFAGYDAPATIRRASVAPWSSRQVYNLEVEDTHTFYVGEQRILVHNK